MSNKWKLEHGIHQGTITSRDTGAPEEYDSKEKALMAYRTHRKFYRKIGYRIWFCVLTSPDGKQETLESNPVDQY
jgi:hypothetical protein